MLIGSGNSFLYALANRSEGIVLLANRKRILDLAREGSAKVKTLVFIYHLKTSFEQGYLIEVLRGSFSLSLCSLVTFFNATLEIIPTSANRRLIFSLVLNTKQLLIIYKFHSVIITWCNCNNSKKCIYVFNDCVNFKVKTNLICLSLFFSQHMKLVKLGFSVVTWYIFKAVMSRLRYRHRMPLIKSKTEINSSLR